MLQMHMDVMYGKGCGVDDDPVNWIFMHLDKIANSHPKAIASMRYIKDAQRLVTTM